MPDRRWYVSLDSLQEEVGAPAARANALSRYIARASRFMEAETGKRVFIPVTRINRYDAPLNNRDALWLHDDLLHVESIIDGWGALAESDYLLYPLNTYPKARVMPVTFERWWTWQWTREGAIAISGRWGYSESTEDTGLALGSALPSVSATTFTVADTGLEVGWTLLVGSEQLFVKKILDGTVTVERGQNGTTPAIHALGDPIMRYVPEPDVEQSVVLLATTWFHWRDAAGIQSKTIGDTSYSYSGGWPVPGTVRDTIERLKRRV